MKEGLLQLLQLQEVDKELFSLEEAKEKYPSERPKQRGVRSSMRIALYLVCHWPPLACSVLLCVPLFDMQQTASNTP